VSSDTLCLDIDDGAEVVAILRCLQRAVLNHPVAAQAAFAALVAEGRAFLQTEDGREWSRRLESSRLIEKGRALWEVTTLNVLEDDESTVVPSRILDVFVKLTHDHAIQEVLGRLYGGAAGEHSAATP
jgi:hypothetical protein